MEAVEVGLLQWEVGYTPAEESGGVVVAGMIVRVL